MMPVFTSWFELSVSVFFQNTVVSLPTENQEDVRRKFGNLHLIQSFPVGFPARKSVEPVEGAQDMT